MRLKPCSNRRAGDNRGMFQMFEALGVDAKREQLFLATERREEMKGAEFSLHRFQEGNQTLPSDGNRDVSTQ